MYIYHVYVHTMNIYILLIGIIDNLGCIFNYVIPVRGK